jgi:hypothetical protein
MVIVREVQKPNIKIINNNGISIQVLGIKEKMVKVVMMEKDVINLLDVSPNVSFIQKKEN